MPHYLLDTNICIYIAKQHPPEVLPRLGKLVPGAVAMSVVTFGELQFGANRSQYLDKALDTPILAVPALSMDDEQVTTMVKFVPNFSGKASPSATRISGSPPTPDRRNLCW